jgi:hypothetical protein
MIDQIVSGGIGLLIGAVGMLIGNWFQKSRKTTCQYHMEMFEKITVLCTNFERIFEKIASIESKIEHINSDIIKAREDIIIFSEHVKEKN